MLIVELLPGLNRLTRGWNPEGVPGSPAATDQIADTVIHGFAVG